MGTRVFAALACVFALVACGCVTNLTAVAAAGNAAQKLGDEASSLDVLVTACSLDAAFNNKDPNSECGSHKKSIAELIAVAKGLTTYGAKLSALATNADGDPSTAVGGFLAAGASAGWYSTLSASNSTDAKNLAKSIVTWWSAAQRSNDIACVVHDVDPTLQTEAAAISGVVTLEKKAIQDYEKDIDTKLAADAKVDGWRRLQVYELILQLQPALTQLDALAASVNAFAKAHGQLEAVRGKFDSNQLRSAIAAAFQVAADAGLKL
jgi:hypothetical protein